MRPRALVALGATWLAYAGCSPPAGCASCAAASIVAPTVPLALAVDSAFQREVAAGFSGNVLLARRGAMLLRRGYGLADREAARPFSPSTGIDIGSLTKQFTATAILRLEADGRLRVQDSLGKFFPQLPPDRARITLHRLLTHASGLPLYAGGDYDAVSRDSLVRWLASVPLGADDTFSYSNPGYSVLAAVIEVASGQPYQTFVQSRLFGPAGLRHTGYRISADDAKRLEVGYDSAGVRWGTPADSIPGADPSWTLIGNGEMVSTLDDLYAWNRALRDGRVLEAGEVEKLFTPHIQRGAGSTWMYGYGWQVKTGPSGRVIDHTGSNDVFFVDMRWYRDADIVLIFATNHYTRPQLAQLLRQVDTAVTTATR